MTVQGLNWVHVSGAGECLVYDGLVVGYVTQTQMSPNYNGWANGHGIVTTGPNLEAVKDELLKKITEIVIKSRAVVAAKDLTKPLEAAVRRHWELSSLEDRAKTFDDEEDWFKEDLTRETADIIRAFAENVTDELARAAILKGLET